MKPITSFLLAVVTTFSISCSSVSSTPAPHPATEATHYGEEQLQSVLWVQNAVEYRALTIGAYSAATRMLDVALADESWQATIEPAAPGPHPPAIILDLDETCLDNSAYQAQLLAAHVTHSEARFDAFVKSGAVGAIPGALEFLNYAHGKGVKIFYITNQDVKLEDASRRTLTRLHYPVDTDEDVVLTVNDRPEWSASDKALRRAWVAQHYRVLLLVGDDFNDFVSAKTTAEREELFAQYGSFFGTKWFAIPNPMYGSWERTLLVGAPHDPSGAFDAKLRLLRTTATK